VFTGCPAAIFVALNCLENRFSLARFYAGDDLGEILWCSISVMVPAAHRLKIWVQIWAQFSLLGAPSALFTLLGITEDASEVSYAPLVTHTTKIKTLPKVLYRALPVPGPGNSK
jgi:hypothetical protein